MLFRSQDDKEIIFGCTGTIGEKFPLEKIKISLPELVEKINFIQKVDRQWECQELRLLKKKIIKRDKTAPMEQESQKVRGI